MPGLLVALAGIAGALGVALSAVGAHRAGAENLITAAQFLLFHAPAFLALAALSHGRVLPRWAIGIGALLLAAGLGGFAGDLASRVFLDRRLFPMAAPIGGSLMIIGWLWVGIAGVVSMLRGAGAPDGR